LSIVPPPNQRREAYPAEPVELLELHGESRQRSSDTSRYQRTELRKIVGETAPEHFVDRHLAAARRWSGLPFRPGGLADSTLMFSQRFFGHPFQQKTVTALSPKCPLEKRAFFDRSPHDRFRPVADPMLIARPVSAMPAECSEREWNAEEEKVDHPPIRQNVGYR
jgi:hypothetical protein